MDEEQRKAWEMIVEESRLSDTWVDRATLAAAAVIKRAGDVEKLTKIIARDGACENIARAVRDYLLGK